MDPRKVRYTQNTQDPPGGVCMYSVFFPREKIDLSQQAATWEAEILKKGQSLQYLWALERHMNGGSYYHPVKGHRSKLPWPIQ